MRTVQLAVAARSLNAFSVQVNTAFLALVVTTNLVAPVELFSIALLPAHRREPLSLALVKRTLCAPPRHGSILGATVPRRGVARACLRRRRPRPTIVSARRVLQARRSD